MTAKEVWKKFSGAKVRFASYFKHEFCYEGKHRGCSITCYWRPDDVYSHNADSEEDLFCDGWSDEWYGEDDMPWSWDVVEIRDKNNEVVFEYDRS